MRQYWRALSRVLHEDEKSFHIRPRSCLRPRIFGLELWKNSSPTERGSFKSWVFEGAEEQETKTAAMSLFTPLLKVRNDLRKQEKQFGLEWTLRPRKSNHIPINDRSKGHIILLIAIYRIFIYYAACLRNAHPFLFVVVKLAQIISIAKRYKYRNHIRKSLLVCGNFPKRVFPFVHQVMEEIDDPLKYSKSVRMALLWIEEHLRTGGSV